MILIGLSPMSLILFVIALFSVFLGLLALARLKSEHNLDIRIERFAVTSGLIVISIVCSIGLGASLGAIAHAKGEIVVVETTYSDGSKKYTTNPVGKSATSTEPTVVNTREIICKKVEEAK